MRSRPATPTVPATFGVPLPGLYGTQEEIQAPVATLLKTPLIVSSALYTFAPNVARPGVPTGTSGGGRQIAMKAGPNCRLRLGRARNVGTFKVCPAADSTITHVASGAVEPMQAPCCAAGTWPGAATTSWPSSGRSAPARSSA